MSGHMIGRNRSAASDPTSTSFGAGCFLAALGTATAGLAWAPKAKINITGGFENHARDLSVLYIDLPLVLLGGALVPVLTWTLTARWVHRPWVAGLAAVAALALGVWGLVEWWTPRTQPHPGYGGPGV